MSFRRNTLSLLCGEKTGRFFEGAADKKVSRFGEYRQVLLFSYRHPLAKKQEISSNDLKGYLEIFCEDPSVPFLEKANTEKKTTDLSGKSLFL